MLARTHTQAHNARCFAALAMPIRNNHQQHNLLANKQIDESNSIREMAKRAATTATAATTKRKVLQVRRS